MYNSRDSDIIAALEKGDVLTPAIANTRWGVLALHSAISRLRKQGHAISCKMVNGHGEYRLASVKSSAAQSSTARVVGGPSQEGLRQGEIARAEHPEVGQERVIFGKRCIVTATGISAYDGTRWMAVRDI